MAQANSGLLGEHQPRKSPHRRGPGAYRDFMQGQTRRGNYFPLFRPWLATFTLRQAALVSWFLTVGQVKADERGWVWATVAFVQQGTGLSETQQERVLEDLERQGVVQARTQDGRRYLRINVGRLDELLVS